MSFASGCNVVSSSGFNPKISVGPPVGSPRCSYAVNSSYLKVSFGQATFDAEGVEAPGPWFSRTIHYPGGSQSGVTIGRGYDMGWRSSLQVERELTSAGVSTDDARWIASAAGLRGLKAQDFTDRYQSSSPVISLEAQQALFERVVTPQIVSDISRMLTKPDVVHRYGKIEWGELKPEVQELLFDLRYRGDYRPETRIVLQPYIAANDSDGLREVMAQKDYWRSWGVPASRIDARLEILNRRSRLQ